MKNYDINRGKLDPVEEIKKDYLENLDFFGNRVSIATLFKKYCKKYNIDKHSFLSIINEAHEDLGSAKRYSFNKQPIIWKNYDRTPSDLPPHNY